MKVLKFGGTSVGSAQRMKEVAKLITDGERKIVVLSAMSGTTNTLVEISDYLYKKNPEGANEIINRLEAKYRQHIDELYSTPEYKQKGQEFIKSHFDYIRSYTKDLFTLFEEKVLLAQGELISTGMMNYYLQECGVNSVLLPALEYMRTDKNAEPDPVYIREKLQMQLELHPDADIYITQGFICRNAYGEIDNLQRGGSDYTASLIGAAVTAEEIQIWTDIDGMHNNDPRIVDKTSPVRQLHFEEAAELAYFGAKILHPTCIQPAKYANIPVRLLNTMEPTAPGTLISNDTEKGKIKAVAARSMTRSMSAMLMPNLFSANPVVMLAWVWAPTSGLMRKATLATLPRAAASWSMTSSSGTDSTLKQKMLLSSPRLISQSALPTPAKTILEAGKPARKAA